MINIEYELMNSDHFRSIKHYLGLHVLVYNIWVILHFSFDCMNNDISDMLNSERWGMGRKTQVKRKWPVSNDTVISQLIILLIKHSK